MIFGPFFWRNCDRGEVAHGACARQRAFDAPVALCFTLVVSNVLTVGVNPQPARGSLALTRARADVERPWPSVRRVRWRASSVKLCCRAHTHIQKNKKQGKKEKKGRKKTSHIRTQLPEKNLASEINPEINEESGF